MGEFQKYQAELVRLIAFGRELAREIDEGDFRYGIGENLVTAYQGWYTEGFRVTEQLLPERSLEFKEAYVPGAFYALIDGPLDLKPPSIHLDWLRSAIRHIRIQNDILCAAERVLNGSLSNIRTLMQADLFDSELDAARGLLDQGFVRPAGVVAGVVLEGHLAQVATNHELEISKQNPTLGDLNSLLKKESVLDTPAWRRIQWLSDVRNWCAHNQEQEPTTEDVGDLINGVDKIIKSVF